MGRLLLVLLLCLPRYEVDSMLEEAELLLTGHPDQGKRPLLRLRVEYTEESQVLNPSRFGNHYLDQVSRGGRRSRCEQKVEEVCTSCMTGLQRCRDIIVQEEAGTEGRC